MRASARGAAAALAAALLCATFLLASCATTGDGRPAREGTMEDEKPFPNSVFLEVDGIRLHLQAWLPASGAPVPSLSGGGRRGALPVILVHGDGGSTFDWRFQGEALAAAGFEAWAIDLPPFGWSALADPLPKGAEARAALLADTLEAIDARMGREEGGGWNLVGHSLGGRIASYLSITRPERVASLILVAPAIYTRIPSLPFIGWPVAKGLVDATARAFIQGEWTMRRVLALAYGREPSAEEATGHFAPARRPGSAEAFMAWNAAPKEASGPDPRLIPLPALVIYGDRDRIVDHHQGPRLLAAMPGSRLLVLQGGGHCVMETEPAGVSEAILEWLSSPAPGGPVPR